MRIWVIEPRDPFIARDGKPFGAIPGARASSLPFPFPSTTTGGVRTRAGLNANGIFTASPEDSRTIEVAGPFLVELNQTGEIAEWLVPAPADALLFETNRKDDRTARCKQLVPQVVPA
ncbi:MAG TPA: type III-B CRISPR module-associated Cmr3 family protein, partial [Acidobacteriota bacterium]|nr:type III-B CRISPR module-associated Cmr3 family protein [Acidobacteriota bacterium]